MNILENDGQRRMDISNTSLSPEVMAYVKALIPAIPRNDNRG